MSFTVYRSSAGSGKTYTLVKEYLRIVLHDPSSYNSVLAITFTNKAANEMRERIMSYLREISEPETYKQSTAVTDLLPELIELTGLERQKVIANSGKVLKNILHNYQDFSVSTIDSFIHRIIRTFAFDLHLPLNFEVEVDDASMVSMAIDLLLSRVGVDKVPTDILKKYTESRIDDEKNWDIEKDLKGFSKQLMKDDIVEFLPALNSMDTSTILSVSKVLITKIQSFEKQATQMASELKAIWDEHGLEASDLSRGRSGIWGIVNRLANKDYSNLRINSYIEKTLGEDKWCSTKADDTIKATINSLKGKMLTIAAELISLVEDGESQYVFYNLLKRNIFNLAILNEIESVLSQIRESEGMIHISEFDKRIAAVVNNEPVPFIYERLGERYQHFLIDEFQDTSVLEWHNILPLIENSLATDKFNMIVGDAKQAIYRFKGGEVDQLADLPEIFKRDSSPEMISREEQLKRCYHPEPLKYNFRSRKEIVDFNNDLYTYLGEQLPDGLKKFYKDCRQALKKEKPGGEVRIKFIDAEGRKEDREPWYFNGIKDIIEEMTTEKGYSYQDIAILCRSNTDASKVARKLLLNGIEVVSAESLLLRSSPEVNFLVFCLDYISNTADKIALAGMISYLSSHGPVNDLHGSLQKFLLNDKDALSSSYQQFIGLLGDSGIKFIPGELSQMGLYEKVEALIRIFDLNKTPDPYVVFFMDVIFDYSRNKRLLPEDFTSYWRENNKKYSIVVPEGLNAVNVMTIHKAKGLQFPIVIYPFANGEVKIAKDKKWVSIDDPELPGLTTALLPLTNDLLNTAFATVHQKEKENALLDVLNILYVATTRPKERLFIMCDMVSARSGNIYNIPSMLRAFLEHQGKWSEGQNEYSFGDPVSLPAGKQHEEDVLVPADFISGDWRKNILLSGNAAEYWDLEDDDRNRQWGNLVHNILSGIHTIADVDEAINREVISGNLDMNNAAELKELLNGILQQAEISLFFDGSYETRNEASVMTPSGKEYRPDRLMIKNNKAIVLDYKTGKEDPKHIRQIETYSSLLADMGYRDIERYLLYIDKSFNLVKV